MSSLFVTGTGTGIGKTVVTAGLVRLLRQAGRRAVPMKPFQTGCTRAAEGLVPPDLVFALEISGYTPAADEHPLLCPFAYEPACSPHLAARLAGEEPDVQRVADAAARLLTRHEIVIAEGAGGLLVPVNSRQTMADVARRLDWPVLVVARAGLGTINETLLTLEALRRRRLTCLGVVLVETAPAGEDAIRRDNPAAIAAFGRTQILGRIPWLGPDLGARSPAWARFAASWARPIDQWSCWT